MKVLITGGNGHLGRHLVRQLRDAGHAVRTSVRDASD
ncbi:MAG: NAD-dependent epimerase/dehydratase family protein, partial [Pseudomonadota bacterium]